MKNLRRSENEELSRELEQVDEKLETVICFAWNKLSKVIQDHRHEGE